MTNNCLDRLHSLGISEDDALALRRISITLQKWFEGECGNSNRTESWAIVRGGFDRAGGGGFIHNDEGKPYRETHANSGEVRYHGIPDRERSAMKRLAKIMEKYPSLKSFIQTDPRGASLYILRPDDVPAGAQIDSCYSNGIAVYK